MTVRFHTPPRRALAAALALGLAAAAGNGAAATRDRQARATEAVPAPHEVHSRSGPLKQARTVLLPMDAAPFPYDGIVPRSGRPFLDVDEWGRKGHTTGSGRVLWQDETFADNRALLHIPKGFDVRKPGLMVVFLHGHGATLARDVRDRQRVPAQVSASGINAVLVAPQLAYDARDSSAGKFWQPGGFARFVGEAGQKLAKLHGDPRSARTFASMPVVIVAYSGGYLAAASCAQQGGLKKRLRGIVLLDALYGELEKFASFIKSDPSAFFVSAYLGSTRERNAALAQILEENEIPATGTLDGKLRRGSVAIISGGEDVTHRDLVSRAWTDNPIQDLLSRMKEFRR